MVIREINSSLLHSWSNIFSTILLCNLITVTYFNGSLKEKNIKTPLTRNYMLFRSKNARHMIHKPSLALLPCIICMFKEENTFKLLKAKAHQKQ